MADHDGLFKRAMSVPAHAAGELRSLLPESVTSALDLERATLESGTFVDPELQHRHSDLLFRVPLRDNPSQSACVYFLLEHQSEPDPVMPWRVFNYTARIYERLMREEPTPRTLPGVIMVVVHHGEGGWGQAPRRLTDMLEGLEVLPQLRPYVPEISFVLDDLALVDDDALRARPLSPFPRVALWLLRDGRTIDRLLTHLANWAREVGALAEDDQTTALRYLLLVSGPHHERVRERVLDAAPQLEPTMTNLQYFISDEARREERRQGKIEGERALLIRMLERRFGALPELLALRIQTANESQLEAWSDALWSATSLDALLGD